MTASLRSFIFSILTTTCAIQLVGCSSSSPHFNESSWDHHQRVESAAVFDVDHVRQLPMYSGRTARPLDWADVLHAADWADVIFIGEQHDDALGHAFQQAVTKDVLAGRPGGALSMEMLERDDQALADDYIDGIVDAATFEKLTHSTDWGDKGKWPEWYQPIVDAAKDNGASLVAANAPRRYVRLARSRGYDFLRSLPEDRRALYAFPMKNRDDGYWKRFVEVMTENGGHGGPPSEERLEELRNGFRSQSMWDATMADSIAKAHRAGAGKIVHLVGQFHSDFNGGTVQQLRARWPEARILVISMQREDGQSLRDEDRGRADIIVYTGARPPEPATQPDEPAATQPEEPTSQPQSDDQPPMNTDE